MLFFLYLIVGVTLYIKVVAYCNKKSLLHLQTTDTEGLASCTYALCSAYYLAVQFTLPLKN